MAIERISPTHPRQVFGQIARLHVQEIHHGLLPLLGLRFMTRMYYEMSRAPRTGVWAAIEGGEVMGFIAGCADVGQTYRATLLRRGPLLALLALRAAVRPNVLKRLPSLLLYPFRLDPQRPESHAELLALAVDQRAHRRGLGRGLVAAFEDGLRAWGGPGSYQVLTNIEEVASNGFYRGLGLEPRGTIEHHDLVLQRYMRLAPPA